MCQPANTAHQFSISALEMSTASKIIKCQFAETSLSQTLRQNKIDEHLGAMAGSFPDEGSPAGNHY